MRTGRWMLAAFALLVATGALAHETRPGLPDLREVEPGIYNLLWKKPSAVKLK